MSPARTGSVEIRGRSIAAGDRVTLWIPSANRDEDVFDDPDRFDVSRTPNRHLAMGAGEHFCLGSTLARAELRLLYGELLRQTGPDPWELANIAATAGVLRVVCRGQRCG